MKNKFQIINNIVKILFKNDKVGYCDIEDWEYLKNHLWRIHHNLLSCSIKFGDKYLEHQMSRMILSIKDPNISIIHKDGNTLNNCKQNLVITKGMDRFKKSNNYEILQGEKLVKVNFLEEGLFGYIDFDNWENLKSKKIFIRKSSDNLFYMMLHINNKTIKFVHDLIMNPSKGYVVNHKDHNGLNNCKSNLEICTQQQNSFYSRTPKNNTSGYKGVTWDKSRNMWVAGITLNYKRIYLGRFDNIIDAAKAYNEAALKYFEEFAVLNEIPLSLDEKILNSNIA